MSELFAVDVGTDFVEAVVTYVEDRLREADAMTVLFPNRRAVRFFEQRLSSPSLLRVTVAALEDYAKETVYARSEFPPLFQLDIDRYFMLYDILEAHPALYHELGGRMEHVFPWCVHLSNLFDEFDQHLVTSVKPLQYIDSVIDEARKILGNLDVLYQDYRRVVQERNLTYHGDLFRRLDALKGELTGPFVLAGFSLLTSAQKSLFFHLFRHNDTAVFFHTDLRGRHPVGNPYRLYDDWMRGEFWGIKPKRLSGGTEQPEATSITFHESFDTHAEVEQVLTVMGETLPEIADEESPLDIGVVLPDGSGLFPLLYGLATFDRPMNVTLGFPFEKSVFHCLLDTLMELALTYHEVRGFHYVPLLRLLAHPFIQSIQFGSVPFSETAGRLRDEIVSRNLTFVRFEDLMASSLFPEADLKRIRQVHDEILFPFVSATTLRQIGRVLHRLLQLIREPLSTDPAYELERQMARNFLDQVLPNFTHSSSADRSFASPRVLCRAIKHLIAPIHLPFEGDPLRGTQVLGMLESRLLNFRHLFVLDVNEGILPKTTKVDPLFPASLHPLAGLPSLRRREDLFQYYFFRLVDGARHAHIFYQNGISGDEKRIRSRYVEQILLEQELGAEEASFGRVEDLEAALVDTYSFQIPPPVKPETSPSPFYAQKVEECLRGNISATLLDTYLFCPYRFYLEYILKMDQQESVEEGQSPLEVGTMIHQILDKAFSRFLRQPLSPESIRAAREMSLEKIAPEVQRQFSHLSTLRRDLLIHLARFRLRSFFEETQRDVERYHRVRIMETERPLTVSLHGYTLKGRIDRIDELMESPNAPVKWRVIDYKTGKNADVPTNTLSSYLNAFNFSDHSLTALMELKGKLRSIQLPLYLYLFKRAFPKRTGEKDAALWLLGTPLGDTPLKSFQSGGMSLEMVERVILYLIDHMRYCEAVAPHEASHCSWCPYLRVCEHVS